MEKLITFINRTKEQIITAFSLLRRRYKAVRVAYQLKNGMYNGYFLVVGSGVRRGKWG